MATDPPRGIAALAALYSDSGRGQFQRTLTDTVPERMKTLLRAAAADLRDGRAPLSGDFLAEHDVTLDEAYDLTDWIATAIDMLTGDTL